MRNFCSKDCYNDEKKRILKGKIQKFYEKTENVGK